MIVVDASLAAKTVLRELGSDAAHRFHDKHMDALNAPDLLLSEVTSAIVRRANEREFSNEEALANLAGWVRAWRNGLYTSHRLTDRRAAAAGMLAIGLGHPLADCIYLALAIEFGCPLATCDRKFAAKARPSYAHIDLIEAD